MITSSILHRINLTEDSAGSPTTIENKGDFSTYTTSLINEFKTTSRYKSYKFASQYTEVAGLMNNISAENWQERAQVIVERLHRIEKDTKEAIKHITELRRGSFVQILTEIDEVQAVILTKVDSIEYLDDSNLEKRAGLPFANKIQKFALIYLNSDSNVIDIKVGDSNSKISAYWWKDFLELEEINTSEKNTLSSFNAIDKVLTTELKNKDMKSDYWELRNALISYYRTSESFVFDTLISTVFSNYQKNSDALDMNLVVNKIKAVKDKLKFDGQFDITQSAIKARIKSKITLAKNLDLTISGEIENIESVINTGISTDGRKYLQIFSDAGYDEFK